MPTGLQAIDAANAPFSDTGRADAFIINYLMMMFNGNRVLKGCAPTVTGSNKVVSVATGAVMIDGKETRVTAQATGTLTSDGSNPIYYIVWVDNTGTVGFTAASAASIPLYPADPASKAIIALVYFNAGSSLNITALYPATPTASTGVCFDMRQYFPQQTLTAERTTRIVEFFDDFVGGDLLTSGAVGQLGWKSANTGTGSGLLNGVSAANLVGMISLLTGTTSSGLAVIYLSPGGVSAAPIVYTGAGSGPDFCMEWRVAIPNLSVTTQDFRIVCGLGNVIDGSQPTSGIFFMYDRNANGANWFVGARNASAGSLVDSGVAVTTSYVRLKIISRNEGGTDKVHFYVDDVECTNSPVTANLPAAVALYPLLAALKVSGTTSRQVNIDSFYTGIHVAR